MFIELCQDAKVARDVFNEIINNTVAHVEKDFWGDTPGKFGY